MSPLISKFFNNTIVIKIIKLLNILNKYYKI